MVSGFWSPPEATARKEGACSCAYNAGLPGQSLRTHPHSPALTATIFSIHGAGCGQERSRLAKGVSLVVDGHGIFQR